MTNLTWHTYRTAGIPPQTISMTAHCDGCGWNTQWDPAAKTTETAFVTWANKHTHNPVPVHVSRYTIIMTVYDDNTVSTAECNHCPWELTDTTPIRDAVETHWHINHNPEVTGK